MQEETVIVDHASIDLILSEEVATSSIESSCVYLQSPSPSGHRDADDEAMQLMISWERMSKAEQLILGSNTPESKNKLSSKENETACILQCNASESDIVKHPTKIVDANKNPKIYQPTQRVQEFRCAECNKLFRKRDTFTEHMLLIHLGKNPYKYEAQNSCLEIIFNLMIRYYF